MKNNINNTKTYLLLLSFLKACSCKSQNKITSQVKDEISSQDQQTSFLNRQIVVNVFDVFEDSKVNLWFGILSKGLAKYNGHKLNLSLTFFLSLCFGMMSCFSNRLTSDYTIRNDYVSVSKDENLYCSKYEVTNKEYRTFLATIKTTDALKFEKCKIDSLKWSNEDEVFAPHLNNYHWHPAFDDYPVVNISHFGATEYCKWLTSLINDSELSFRLPTETEFNQLMKIADVTLLSDNPDDYFCPNFNLTYESNAALDGGLATVSARKNSLNNKYHYFQNKNGLFHVVGNVSEFLNDGRSMGGSWNTLPSEVSTIIQNPEGDAKTGFRVWIQKK